MLHLLMHEKIFGSDLTVGSSNKEILVLDFLVINKYNFNLDPPFFLLPFTYCSLSGMRSAIKE